MDVGGHFGTSKTTAKVLQSGFWWPSLFKDAREFVLVIGAKEWVTLLGNMRCL